eukprot:CAMPEP_0114243258 /NCGR_PEP_ID=MMETSP0058-20121206/10685_1 /TAXON_ID=36894 /ORGANISM="Pyramimonas parkeae, CCMP726" /LENGTH=679 /DNA_ID=CAMNT_0001356069 /DNA_START=171 /DNA_END=2207 /DNA_ORIENTATION=-
MQIELLVSNTPLPPTSMPLKATNAVLAGQLTESLRQAGLRLPSSFRVNQPKSNKCTFTQAAQLPDWHKSFPHVELALDNTVNSVMQRNYIEYLEYLKKSSKVDGVDLEQGMLYFTAVDKSATTSNGVVGCLVFMAERYSHCFLPHYYTTPPPVAPVPASRSTSGLSTNHPRMLESQAEEHTEWLFSAVAELVDNAHDAGATNLHIKMINIQHLRHLVFLDDGGGMSHQGVEVDLMRFGHDDVGMQVGDRNRIGKFAAGFKAGCMALGKDALVFTRSREHKTYSMGLLSRTYCEGKQEVVIPVITLDQHFQPDLSHNSSRRHDEYAQLMMSISGMTAQDIQDALKSVKQGGTCIHVFNLTQNAQGQPKLKQMCGDIILGRKGDFRDRQPVAVPPDDVPLDHSLSAYLSVIYLEPKMKIFIEQRPVQVNHLADALKAKKTYKTNEVWTMVPAQDALLPASVGCELVIGESAEEASRHNCGLMMYWNGRLIESYKRVGHFMENEFSTKGVLAVVNADFLVPNSNKQSFKGDGFGDTNVNKLFGEWARDRIMYYRDNVLMKKERENIQNLSEKDVEMNGGEVFGWLQCESVSCKKWRKVSKQYFDMVKTEWPASKSWYCRNHPDPKVNSALNPCSLPEDKEGENETTFHMGRSGRTGRNLGTAVDDVLSDEVSIPIAKGCRTW